MPLSVSERIMYNVVYISMLNSTHNPIGSATGFLYGFCESDKRYVPCLVTNRHVLSNCSYVRLTFTKETDSGEPDVGNLAQIELETSNSIFHPADSIDLAILPIAPAIQSAHASGIKLYFTRFTPDNMLSPEEWKQLSAIENVFMAGFPKGFRDEVNNQPIIRSGITATHPALNFKGRPEFLVDMPCFEGCSGSPVFICNEGLVLDKRELRLYAGNKIKLLGIQYAIPLDQIKGKLAAVPTAGPTIAPVVPLYLNLGFIIKSSELLAFEDIIRAKLDLNSATQAQPV